MHPLSIFPELITFSLLAPLLLRISIGCLIIFLGYDRYFKKWGFTSVAYFLTGIFLILGLYTQIAAIAGIIINLFDFWTNKIEEGVSKEYMINIYLGVVVLLSLLITGPGFFAFDLPL